MKTCRKCGATKEVDDFYRHPNMADGRVNICKECNKAGIRDRRKEDLENARASDRAYYRKNAAKKNALTSSYQKTAAGKEAMVRGNVVWRSKNPFARKAHNAVNNAVRSGDLLKPDACSRCSRPTPSRRLHGHHENYEKRLDVIWLCAKCHSEKHAF